LSVLSIEITNHLLQIEQLGEKGEVAAAMTKTQEVEKLKDEREKIRMSARIQREPTNSYTGLQEKQMEVCEICGSFLIVGDAQVN
jgi:rubrerythrin